ncbi:SH3-containing GRB2-like protein 3-interacting protein 1 [Elephas maximus indicus]|uniref:SH3-containing GRB2-like protein 3-interacting protein 1 n=1 Tax=Elephas maximus indicus TaxID=99487 RepID=UPI0021160B95|nr:SH3-containing GRB2-like protein 3-interacting protein 1 [Elephas maximus indicus]
MPPPARRNPLSISLVHLPQLPRPWHCPSPGLRDPDGWRREEKTPEWTPPAPGSYGLESVRRKNPERIARCGAPHDCGSPLLSIAPLILQSLNKSVSRRRYFAETQFLHLGSWRDEGGDQEREPPPSPPPQARPLPSDNAKAAAGTGWSAEAACPGRRSLPTGRRHAWGGTQGARSLDSSTPSEGEGRRGWRRRPVGSPPPASRGPDLIMALHGTPSCKTLRPRLSPSQPILNSHFLPSRGSKPAEAPLGRVGAPGGGGLLPGHCGHCPLPLPLLQVSGQPLGSAPCLAKRTAALAGDGRVFRPMGGRGGGVQGVEQCSGGGLAGGRGRGSS